MERSLSPEQKDEFRRLYTITIEETNQTAIKSAGEKKRYAFESYDTNEAWFQNSQTANGYFI
jgi:hypothetical protein